MSESADCCSAPPAPAKKKRNLPGTPDPSAEVVALSPATLLATNRFVCEVCGKGFQRDQNLQLHRRGHNLPWRLRQRPAVGPDGGAPPPPRRRVYVCPEVGCVHHDPSRALGDLTGIKKHFCRKHGEKKWKCDRCGKKYAVAADLKAHAKTCGTKDYRCDCGSQFTRRDSFMTHRAFCSALVEESSRVELPLPVDSSRIGEASPALEHTEVRSEEHCNTGDEGEGVADPSPPELPKQKKGAVGVTSAVAQTVEVTVQLPTPIEEELENDEDDTETEVDLHPRLPSPVPSVEFNSGAANHIVADADGPATGVTMDSNSGNSNSSTSLFAGLFTSVGATSTTRQSAPFPDLLSATAARADHPLIVDPSFLCLATGASTSLFSQPNGGDGRNLTLSSTPHMSATALLQKAAEAAGPTTSRPSFLKEFVLTSTVATPSVQLRRGKYEDSELQQWRTIGDERHMDFQHRVIPSEGLGLGLSNETGFHGIPEMMGASSMLRPKPMFDFLSLGIGPVGGSALMTSIAGGLDIGAGTMPSPWDISEHKHKPNHGAIL